jgi:hypothetical protein
LSNFRIERVKNGWLLETEIEDNMFRRTTERWFFPTAGELLAELKGRLPARLP